MAASPVPVGWLEEADTLGIFKADKMKAYAPAMASRIKVFRWLETVFLMRMTPTVKNGMQTAPQPIHQPGERYPSAMCIAPTVCVAPNIRAKAAENATSLFSSFVMKTPP